MKTIQYFLITTALIINFYGCTEEFLDIHSKTSISTAVFPTTMEQTDLLVNTIYGDTHQYGLYGFIWFGLGNYLYDHTSDLAYVADADRSSQAMNKSLPSGVHIKGTWNALYQSIQHCNTLLEAIPVYTSKYAKDGDMAALNYMKGQALFMRAFFYWHLQIFCQLPGDGLGVPLVDKVPTTMDEMMVSRSSTAQYWAFIIKDLKEAIPLLAGKTDAKRATEWAAKGLLAKVYAFSGDWVKAKPALKDVIDNSGKTLVSNSVYQKMFFGEEEFNNESLFEIDLTVDKTNNSYNGINTGSAMPLILAATYVTSKGEKIGAGWSNNFVHDKNLFRFGFNLPIPVRIDNPAYDKTKDVMPRNMNKICTDEYIQASQEMRTNKTVDPRLFITCYQPYIDTMMVSGKYVYINQYLDVPNDKYHGWSHRKYTNTKGTEEEVSNHNGNNIHFLRMADIYLLYAEACKESEPDAALEYINKVKRRAYSYPMDVPSAVDYASLTAPTPAQPGDPLANDPLKYERWAELFAEGQWWLDVRRWKIGDKEAAYFISTRSGTIVWDDDHYAQPIPTDELNRNANMVPNPGY